MLTNDLNLAEDLLDGADAIAEFLGDGWNVRRIYYCVEREQLPVIRTGKRIVGSKSRLRRHFAGEAA